jgi:hypothetical protein
VRKEVADHCPDFLRIVRAKWPVSKKWIVAPGMSRLNASALRQEEGIVLSPHRQEAEG